MNWRSYKRRSPAPAPIAIPVALPAAADTLLLRCPYGLGLP